MKIQEEVLKEKVFSKKMPIVFSSATLSENKSFDFIANSIGVHDYLSLSVDSPFDYDEQMNIQLLKENQLEKKLEKTLEELNKTEGRGLVLFTSQKEIKWFKERITKHRYSYPLLFEGDQEISSLVKEFQQNEHSVLCAVHLWEGLDIPGPSLSNVIIWSLPYPPDDPVFEAKKSDKQDPYKEVELPYMILRLRQGIGRLIRTSDDKGSITIFYNDQDQDVLDHIKSVLPVPPTFG